VNAHRRQRGASLVELMIALLLGLVVVGAAMAVFLANKQTYVATESIGRLQQTSRVAFELMARDLREGASDECGAGLADAVNVLNGPSSRWYTDVLAGIRGYAAGSAFPDAAFGTGESDRVAGTDAVALMSAGPAIATIVKHNPPAASFQVNTTGHGLSSGDIAIACDAEHAAVFQVTSASSLNTTIVHNTGTVPGGPGNCTQGLGAPLDCASTAGSAYQFGCEFGGTQAGTDCTLPADQWSAFIAPLRALRWYVGCNGRIPCSEPGGRSLYRARLDNDGGSLAVDSDEITEGVSDMTLGYLVSGGTGYVDASAVGNWSAVVAVRVELALASPDLVDGQPVTRTLEHVVTLRSRAP
jgi:type IV pilus assembly protein PilW